MAFYFHILTGTTLSFRTLHFLSFLSRDKGEQVAAGSVQLLSDLSFQATMGFVDEFIWLSLSYGAEVLVE